MSLKVSDGIGAWIDDFKKSDAPQFKGKSDKERRDQAIAAYLSAKRGDKQENVKSADRKPEIYTKPDGKRGVRMVATDREVVKTEGYVSMAQQRAVWATRKDGGKGHPDNKKKSKKEDASSDAVKAYMAKGGKVTKLPPGKAAGYHGKDDPGKDVHGVMDRGDTKQLPRKKVKSMEANDYKVQVTGPDHAGVHKVKAKSQDHAHQMVMKKIGQSKLPKHMQPKTRIMGESVDELSMYTSKKLPNLSYPRKKTKFDKEKARLDMLKKNKQKDEEVNELKTSTINSYAKKSKASTDRATNSAVATILRKGDHSKDLNTMRKRKKGMELAKSRSIAKLRKEEMSFAVSIEGLPQMFISADSPGMLKQTLRKIVKQPSMIQSVKRVTDATVKKTFRLKAQGREEGEE
jgi:hypothetical protein